MTHFRILVAFLTLVIVASSIAENVTSNVTEPRKTDKIEINQTAITTITNITDSAITTITDSAITTITNITDSAVTAITDITDSAIASMKNMTDSAITAITDVKAIRIYKTIGVALGVALGATLLFPVAVYILLCCIGFGMGGIASLFPPIIIS